LKFIAERETVPGLRGGARCSIAFWELGAGDVFLTAPLKDEVVVAKPDGSGGYAVSLVDNSGLSRP
jgi:hypothetical protein